MTEPPMPHDPYAESEDAVERSTFNRMCVDVGGPLEAIAGTLVLWSRMAPPQGSYSKMLAIYANEVRQAATALARLSAPVTDVELDDAAVAVEAIALVNFEDSEPRSARKLTQRIVRAALTAHRAGRGM